MNADARELQLFIDNDGDLHRQQYVPILKNLMTKHGQGRYNRQLAVKLLMYLVDNGAKKYAKEHGSADQPWHKLFPKALRTKVAEALRDEFEDEAKLGNYDDMLPKKYKGKVSGKTIGESTEVPEAPEDGPLFDEGTRKALGEAAGGEPAAKDIDAAKKHIGWLAKALANGQPRTAKREFKSALLFLAQTIDAESPSAFKLGEDEARKIYRSLMTISKSL